MIPSILKRSDYAGTARANPVTTILRIEWLSLNRGQRLLLYGATAVWFIVFVLSHHRNYRDVWILEDIFWPFVIFGAVFLWILSREHDNRVVALLCGMTVLIVASIPALKYQQPYGISIDATGHYLLVKSLIKAGRILSGHTYASIPGMHTWLASLALTGGFMPSSIIKFGFPLVAGAGPLFVYWLCRGVGMPAPVTKYTIVTSCLVIYPHFTPNGTSFTVLPLFTLLGVLLVRENYARSWRARLVYTVIFLLVLTQLIVWHSTTPMLLPSILVSVAFSPVLVELIARRRLRIVPSKNVLRAAVLASILFFGYHAIEVDRVYQVGLVKAQEILFPGTQEAVAGHSSIVPQRLFQVTPIDVVRITLVIHGPHVVLLGLMALGLIVIWRYRARWESLLYFYAWMLLICAPFILLIFSGGVGGGYRRWILIPLAVAPFFAGPGLWWLYRQVQSWTMRGRWWIQAVWAAFIILILGVWMVEVFNYQPIVPKADAVAPDTPDEYIVWLHGVNSAYQQRMLTFAETHTEPDTNFAADIVGSLQYRQYFGIQAVARRGLYLPLHWQEPIDNRKVKLFLLHWPGPAGGLGEQVEFRSTTKIRELRDTPGWGLIYDNGESFILLVR